MKSFTLQDAIRLGNRGEAEVESTHWPSAKRHIMLKLSDHVSGLCAKTCLTVFLQVGTLGSSGKQLLQKYVSDWLSSLGFAVSFPSLVQVQVDWSQAVPLTLPDKVTAGDWTWVGSWTSAQDGEGESILLDDKTATITLGFSARSVKTAQHLIKTGEQRLRFEMLHSRCVDAIKQAILRGVPSCRFWVKPTINGKSVDITPLYHQLIGRLKSNGFSVEQKDESMVLNISGWHSNSNQEAPLPPPTSLFSAVAAAADYSLRKSSETKKEDIKTQPSSIPRDQLLHEFVHLLFEYWKHSQTGQEVPLDLWSRLKQSETLLLSRLT